MRLQIKYIDKTEGELSKLSNDQIKYYNKILLTQLRELQEQYDMMTGWGPIGSFYRQFCGSPDIMDMKIDREKRNLEKDLEHVTNDTEEFKNKKTLRGFLRQYVIRPPMSSFFDDFFGGF